MKKLFVALTIFLLSSSLVFAQAYPPRLSSLRNWLMGLGTWIIFLSLMGGLLIFLAVFIRNWWPGWSMRLSIIGMIIILLGILSIQIVYLVPYLGKPIFTYQVCEGMPWPPPPAETLTTLPDPIADFILMTSCVLIGYVPTSAYWWGVVSFFIFSFILPLAVLIVLFSEFLVGIGGGIFSQNARRVLAFCVGLIAYRFLMATLLIELWEYGVAGVGKLALDILLFLLLWGGVKKLWAGYEEVETFIEAQREKMIEKLQSELARKRNLLGESGVNENKRKTLEKEIKELEKRLEKYGIKLKKKREPEYGYV